MADIVELNLSSLALLKKHEKEVDKFLTNVFQKHPFILVVMADWCGHCQHFKPQIRKAVLMYKKANASDKSKSKGATATKSKKAKGNEKFYIVRMNDEVASHFMNQNNLFGNLIQSEVSGYPTMLAVNRVKSNTLTSISFSHERTPANIMMFITNAVKLM